MHILYGLVLSQALGCFALLYSLFSPCVLVYLISMALFLISLIFFLFYYVKSTDEPDKRHSSYLLFLIPRVSI